ncbi:MAG: hypothetical protein QOE14_240 [Humisphaera sp.]|nr:hypothetical protein [Humisphaera sp.]
MAQAIAHHQAGRLDGAERLYRALLSDDASNADALHLLGVVAHQRQRDAEALDLIARAIALRPREAKFHNNLGEVLRSLNRVEEAAAAYERAIALKPDYAEALNNLGLALHRLGRLDDAIAAGERAIRFRPNYAKAWNNLGILLAEKNTFAGSRRASETALREKPDYAEAHNNLGALLADHGLLGPAERHFREAIRINPNYANAYNGLGGLLGRQGKLDEAIVTFRHGLQLKPDAAHHSNLLLYLQYASGLAPADLLDAHREWARLYADPLTPAIRPHENDLTPDRRLRVGYVSPDFRSHPVSYFFEPLLDAHDRNGFEIFCYASVTRPDEVTDRLRARADVWRDVRSLDDATLAEVIRADRIDILVDLSVHLAHNRLLTFAQKPAPVQVTYLGYPGTSGMTTMDYKLSDPHLDPPDRSESFDVERVLRLPESYFCYRPDARSLDVSPLPAVANGHVTFASVNTLLKVTPQVYAAWSQILTALPGARLIMQTGGLDDPATQAIVRENFARHGISPERLEFIGFRDFHQFLALFARVDIALDAFPYSSGTTTCHTLWMGVPVITLAGETGVQRMGLSVLANVGLNELVATTPQEYADVAIALAADRNRLAAMRSSVRERMRASPLLDAPRHARNLERLYREMWQKWTR